MTETTYTPIAPGTRGQILGWHSALYPTHTPPGHCRVLTVLVAGAIGDHAAYSGIGPQEWVARQGQKLSFEETARLFPGLERARYRD